MDPISSNSCPPCFSAIGSISSSLSGCDEIEPIASFSKRQKIVEGISDVDLEKIENYWIQNKARLFELKEPCHIRKSELLPRSLVVIPKGENQGCYILCKGLGGWARQGSYNRATHALNLESKTLAVFRSARALHIAQNELEAQNRYPKQSYFITGEVVRYRGSWKDRINQLTRFINIPKIGMVMPYVAGGELFDAINEKQKGTSNRTLRQWTHIVLHLSKALALEKKAGLVNYDLKPENVLLDENDIPRIVDFGMTYKIGELLQVPCGSPGYVSPEMLRKLRGEKALYVDPQTVIWNMGLIISVIFKNAQFFNWAAYNKGTHPVGRIFDEETLNKRVETLFPKFGMITDIDYIIKRCLRYDPADRITIEDLVVLLEKYLHEVKDGA